jgi:hypothetical protein
MMQAPYPADTRAKGWRFELDYEQIEQSDTWSLAGEVPMAQHALMFMWLMAWKEVPCGSFPNDEAVIRAKCRIPPVVWAKVRGVCMRGWSPASDGRLYHPTITARVLEMLDYRAKNAKRVHDFKERMREQQAANALLTGESPAKNDTGTGTGTNTPQDKPVVERGKRASRKCPLPFLVTPEMQVWAANNTPAVNVEVETAKFLDHTFKTPISDWLGAWRNWMRKAPEFAPRKPATESFAQRAARERVESAVPGVAARPVAPVMEIFDVTARRLG